MKYTACCMVHRLHRHTFAVHKILYSLIICNHCICIVPMWLRCKSQHSHWRPSTVKFGACWSGLCYLLDVLHYLILTFWLLNLQLLDSVVNDISFWLCERPITVMVPYAGVFASIFMQFNTTRIDFIGVNPPHSAQIQFMCIGTCIWADGRMATYSLSLDSCHIRGDW